MRKKSSVYSSMKALAFIAYRLKNKITDLMLLLQHYRRPKIRKQIDLVHPIK